MLKNSESKRTQGDTAINVGATRQRKTVQSGVSVLSVQTRFSPPSALHIVGYSLVTLASLTVAALAFTSGGIYADKTAASIFKLPESKIEMWAILSAVPPGAALSSFALACNIYDILRLMSCKTGWQTICTLGLLRRVQDKDFVEFSWLGYFVHVFTQLFMVIPGAGLAALPSAHAAFSVLTGKGMSWSLHRARPFADSAFISAVSTNTRFLLLKLDEIIAWVNRKTSIYSQVKRNVALAVLSHYKQNILSTKTEQEKKTILLKVVSSNNPIAICLELAAKEIKKEEDIFSIRELSVSGLFKQLGKTTLYSLAVLFGAIYCLPNIASGLDASPLSANLLEYMFGLHKQFSKIPGWLIASASVVFNLPINVPAALLLVSAMLLAQYNVRNVINFIAAAVLPNAIVAAQFFMAPAVGEFPADALTVALALLIGAVFFSNSTCKDGVGFESVARLFCASFFSLSFAFGQAGLLLQFPLDIPALLNNTVFASTIFAATALGYMSISKRFNSWTSGGREVYAAVSNWRQGKDPEKIDNLSTKQIETRLGTIFASAQHKLSCCQTTQADQVFDLANEKLNNLVPQESSEEGTALMESQQTVLQNRQGELNRHNKEGCFQGLWDRLPSRDAWRGSNYASGCASALWIRARKAVDCVNAAADRCLFGEDYNPLPR